MVILNNEIITFCCLLSLFSSSSFAAAPGKPKQILTTSAEKFLFKQSFLNKTSAYAKLDGEETMLSVSGDVQNGENNMKKKSRGRAFLQSLLIPGWGQYYAGSRTMMKVFVVSEVLLWGSYAGFRTWSNWLEDDFHTFAAEHAGAQVDGKPGDYFVDIGNFSSIDTYNQAQLRDRDVNDLYPTTPEFSWQWDSEKNRAKFENIRVRSDRADNRAQLTLAFILVNHLASAVQSTLSVFKFNKKLAKKNMELRFGLENPIPGNRIMRFTMNKHF